MYSVFMESRDLLTEVKLVRKSGLLLSLATDDFRNEMLKTISTYLLNHYAEIKEANDEDLLRAKESNLALPLQYRLKLDEDKLKDTLQGVVQLSTLKNPLGKVVEKRLLDDDLVLQRVTFPLGVIGMIFESRPDALLQIASLCLKSGNGIILKGGKEAVNTNRVLVKLMKEALNDTLPMKGDWIILLETHGDVDAILKMEKDIDLLIPRGSNAFVRHVMNNTHIPVLGHADGICSMYIDNEADINKALAVAVDSKVQYVAVCNALETLLVHKDIAKVFLPLYKSLVDKHNVKIHGDEETRKYIDCIPSTEEDYHTEYLDYEMAIKVVGSIDEAIEHISNHSSGHTDAIVTENEEKKQRFFLEVDSADVFANCSTRFSDGFRYGLGAEVGVSTSKIHARGPVGIEGLTTTKWILNGDGQIVATYSGKKAKPYKHEDLI